MRNQTLCNLLAQGALLGLLVLIVLGNDLRGTASQIAARVMSRVRAGDVLVSSTITDLVAGSGFRFEPLPQRLAIGTDRGLDILWVSSGTVQASGLGCSADELSTEGRRLSPREREVATLIGRGLSNRQIADHLSISIATVERHAANIFNKLAVHSRAQVAVWAVGKQLHLPN